MKGIELSRKFYEEFGAKLIADEFKEYENRIAVGIVGRGSECFGFDDDISLDHDFSAGFSMWLTKKDEEQIGFKLMRAYGKLPKEYFGVKVERQSLFGSTKFGVQTIGDFFKNIVGFEEIPTIWQEWFYVPDHAYAESVNGAIFRDDLGEFTNFQRAIREIPRDIKLKKLAAHLALAAQSGQYNFSRMIKHGEAAGAQLAIAEFVNQVLYVVFSLNNEFLPYYKWRFRALSFLKKFSDITDNLEFLLTSPNDKNTAATKAKIIEEISAKIIEELKIQNLSSSQSDYLENHALSVTSLIKSREISSLHLMDCGE
ncbi:MAG: DUF4037 domain-containing protein [Clostridia bacterium]